MKASILLFGIVMAAVGVVLLTLGGDSNSQFRKKRGTGIVYPVAKSYQANVSKTTAALLTGTGVIMVLLGAGRKR
jgi:hypothetical protein